MRPFIEQAQLYAIYHHNKISRYTHMLGVPLIILSLMILLGFIRIVIIGVLDINLAGLATLGLVIYYARLNWRLTLVIIPIFIILLWIAEFFSYEGPTSFGLWSFLLLFLLGGITQLAGHLIEGKRPAFMDNLRQLLIAPLFLVAELFFMAGRMPELKSKIYNRETEIPPVDSAPII